MEEGTRHDPPRRGREFMWQAIGWQETASKVASGRPGQRGRVKAVLHDVEAGSITGPLDAGFARRRIRSVEERSMTVNQVRSETT